MGLMWSMSKKKTCRPMAATSSSGDQRQKKTVAVVNYNQGKSSIDLSDKYTAAGNISLQSNKMVL